MKLSIELPVFDTEHLTTHTPVELIEIIIEHEDQVPRNVIDECARRGEQMLLALAPIAQGNDELENEISGYWWLRLHAVMILGLIPGEPAGHVLVEFIQGMCREEDDDLQGWFSGYWPALMRNKPPSVILRLRDICADKKIDWFMRTNLTEAVLADAYQQGETELEPALDWAAQFVADEEEDWDYRLTAANDLLDYPRDRHHALVTEMARQQSGFCVHFDEGDISRAYARGTDAPKLERFSDPWDFYETTAIENRQHRWQTENRLEEDSSSAFDDAPSGDFGYHLQETYQRETPKIGRNEPCPCGSGKKYKKCCLGKE